MVCHLQIVVSEKLLYWASHLWIVKSSGPEWTVRDFTIWDQTRPNMTKRYHTGLYKDHTRQYSTIQDNTRPFRTKQEHTGSCGTMRDHGEPCRTMRGNTGPWRDLAGPYGTIRDHTLKFRKSSCCVVCIETWLAGLSDSNILSNKNKKNFSRQIFFQTKIFPIPQMNFTERRFLEEENRDSELEAF